ncbi:unnamed protein product [Sphagnum balticum]
MNLLYYAQGFHLKYYKKPLFDDEIRNWSYGPVPPTAYYSFDKLDTSPALQLDPQSLYVLGDVLNQFGHLSGGQLIDLTRSEDPWKETSRNQVISNERLAEYFSKVENNSIMKQRMEERERCLDILDKYINDNPWLVEEGSSESKSLHWEF